MAQWGILGQGEQWVNTGADGFMEDRSVHDKQQRYHSHQQEDQAGVQDDHVILNENANIMKKSKSNHELLEHSNIIGGSSVKKRQSRLARSRRRANPMTSQYDTSTYMHTNIVVGNTRGGRIITSPPALVAWSVDAIRVVRDQLYRAGNFTLEVPYAENWPREEFYMHGREPSSLECDRDRTLPLWATMDYSSPMPVSNFNDVPSSSKQLLETTYSNNTCNAEADEVASNVSSNQNKNNLIISNLPLMADEVNELLNEIDVQIAEQRKRRLEKLRPPSRWKRNWYFAALGAPVAGYVVYTLAKDNWGVILLKHFLSKMKSFYAEHVYEPLTDM